MQRANRPSSAKTSQSAMISSNEPKPYNECPASNIFGSPRRRRASIPPMDAIADAYAERVREEIISASNARSVGHDSDYVRRMFTEVDSDLVTPNKACFSASSVAASSSSTPPRELPNDDGEEAGGNHAGASGPNGDAAKRRAATLRSRRVTIEKLSGDGMQIDELMQYLQLFCGRRGGRVTLADLKTFIVDDDDDSAAAAIDYDSAAAASAVSGGDRALSTLDDGGGGGFNKNNVGAVADNNKCMTGVTSDDQMEQRIKMKLEKEAGSMSKRNNKPLGSKKSSFEDRLKVKLGESSSSSAKDNGSGGVNNNSISNINSSKKSLVPQQGRSSRNDRAEIKRRVALVTSATRYVSSQSLHADVELAKGNNGTKDSVSIRDNNMNIEKVLNFPEKSNEVNDEESAIIATDGNTTIVVSQPHSSSPNTVHSSLQARQGIVDAHIGDAPAEGLGSQRSLNSSQMPPSVDRSQKNDEHRGQMIDRQTTRRRITSFLQPNENRDNEWDGIGHEAQRRISSFFNRGARASGLIVATLVEEQVEGELFFAEPVGLFDRKLKQFACGMLIFVVLLTSLLSLTLTGVINVQDEEGDQGFGEPTPSPTFDPKSTLEIIQERGYVRCGMRSWHADSREGFNLNLCRSVAAVVVGDPDGYEGVPVTTANRWQLLHDRAVDILLFGDTHTIERETKETSTGVGYAFSSPYTYDGMVYFGNTFFVQCAEEQKRYDDCATLSICVEKSSTHYNSVKTSFPFDHLKVRSTTDEITDMLFNGTCNVAAYDQSIILGIALSDDARDRNFTLGSKMMTKEPLAIVTRNNDRAFSDIINWVLQALLYGEEHGLTKDPTLCHNYANYTELGIHDGPDLDFMKAVYCVGNYGEIFYGEPNNRGRNQLNNGTGMLYAVPFGNLDKDNIVDPASTLAKIRNEGLLKCGVVVPDDFVGNLTESDELVGMGVDYCHTLAAALFFGDSEDVNFFTFPESQNSSYIALANGEIDVLVGGKVQLKYDFALSPSVGGFHFSTPYYYGNEAASNVISSYSMATREDDVMFASFVNCIVLATVYAEENGIQSHRSNEMPFASVFGSALNWGLRDAIAHSGSYDQIYRKHFGSESTEMSRGQNTLNKGGPLMRSFPGLG